tara:strand:- start:549 stop:734 length:186 start_codon:yes stop_codon:yes gene_type:complete
MPVISHDIYDYAEGDRVRATDNGAEYHVIALYPTFDKICVVSVDESKHERVLYRPFELDKI